MGIPNPLKQPGDDQDAFVFKIEIPKILSLLATRDLNGFVPGVDDLLYGNEEHDIMGVNAKVERGRQAVAALGEYKQARKNNNEAAAALALDNFNQHRDYLGYGHLLSVEHAVPPVSLTFYAFRVMVGLGTFFILLFALYLYLLNRGTLERNYPLLILGVLSLFLGYVAQQAGWIVTEVGRQPWAIQDMLPVTVARSNLDGGTVMTTFFLFLILFTVLLIAELKIMARQISMGPEGE
jgi:cytochrome d ubiquinol oxidase subunit I